MIQRPNTLTAPLLLFLWIIVSGSVCFPSPGILEKSYKRYSLYTYMEDDILCEPYTVKKGDWVYKILRSKGEISKTDFSLFLKIFETVNPDIKDVDTLLHGQTILIPLKKIDKKDFPEINQGSVDIPIIQMSNTENKLSYFIKQHRVKQDESVVMIMDRAFLDDNGFLTEVGQALFARLNPEVKDINLIYAGMTLNLPQPGIVFQPWFHEFIGGNDDIFFNREKKSAIKKQPLDKGRASSLLSPMHMLYLEDYALSVEGMLLTQGTYYFPAYQGRDLALDLSSYPLIKLKDGSKIVFMPKEKDSDIMLSLGSMEDVKMMDIPYNKHGGVPSQSNDVSLLKTNSYGDSYINPTATKRRLFAQPRGPKGRFVPADIPESQLIPSDQKDAVEKLMEVSNHPYTPDHPVTVSIGSVSINFNLGKIQRPEKSDLLVVFGDVYGSALDELKKQGAEVVLLSPLDTIWDIAGKIFKVLGVTTTKDPSLLISEINQVTTLPGLYIEDPVQAVFISKKNLDLETTAFLEEKHIKILYEAIR